MKRISIRLSEEEITEIKCFASDKLKKSIESQILSNEKKVIKQINRSNKKRLYQEGLKKKKDLDTGVSAILKIKKAEEFKAELIKNQTDAEKVFKAKLKSIGFNYEFQKIVHNKKGFHILDFYIPTIGLAIELDGGYHTSKDQMEKDVKRSKILKSVGYSRIKRYTNEEALKISDLDLLEHLKSYKKLTI